MDEHIAIEWIENATHAFLKSNTSYTLLEVFMPRFKPAIIDSDFRQHFVEKMSRAEIAKSIKASKVREIHEMEDLRRLNLSKNPLFDKYCFCKELFHGMMYHCELCYDWFHKKCVLSQYRMHEDYEGLNSLKALNFSLMLNHSNISDYKAKWLCPLCVRSRRPNFEDIVDLLLPMLKLKVCLPEDKALYYLGERVTIWLDRASNALKSPNVEAALKIIEKKEELEKKSIDSMNHYISEFNDDGDDYDYDNNYLQNAMEDVNENLKVGENMLGDELQKIISDSEIKTLKELVMEADLFEISLDETDKLWRILSRLQPENPTAQAAKLVAKKIRIQKSRISSISGGSDTQQISLKRDSNFSNLNSENSNDTLIVQSSSNSNCGVGSDGDGVSGNGDGDVSGHSPPTTSIMIAAAPKATFAGMKRRILDSYYCNSSDVGTYEKKRKSDASKEQQQQPSSSADDNNENCTPSRQSNCGDNVSNINTINANTTQRKRKRMSNAKYANASGSSNNGSATRQKKRMHRSHLYKKQKDYEEECRAENCYKPAGHEVDWIQCDGCNKWFHMYCVGFIRSQIEPDDDYICSRCSEALLSALSPTSSTTTIRTTTNSTNVVAVFINKTSNT